MLARFLISLPNFGAVSDQRAANDGVMAGVKRAKTNNLTFTSIVVFNPVRSLRKIATDGPRYFSR